MNFSIASILLATATATSTATTISSKAYRVFNDLPNPKAGKAISTYSLSSVTEGSFMSAKSSKILSFSSSLYVPSSSKSSKILVLPSSSSLSITSKTVKEESKTDKGTVDISGHFGASKSSKGGGAKSAKKSKTGAEPGDGVGSKSSKVEDTEEDSKSSKVKDTGVGSKSSKVQKAKMAKSIPQFSHVVLSLPTYSPTFPPTEVSCWQRFRYQTTMINSPVSHDFCHSIHSFRRPQFPPPTSLV